MASATKVKELIDEFKCRIGLHLWVDCSLFDSEEYCMREGCLAERDKK